MKKSIILDWLTMILFTGCLGIITNMPWPIMRMVCLIVSAMILPYLLAVLDESSKKSSRRETTRETILYLGTIFVAAIILVICCIWEYTHLNAMTVWMVSLIGVSMHRISHNELM